MLSSIPARHSSAVTTKALRRARSLSDSGQTLVMAALMLPVLLGFAALAVDVGYMFDYRKQMQTAADSAAIAGAIADGSGANAFAVEAAAISSAAQNGFVNGTNGVTVTVCQPPDLGCSTTYTYTASDAAVKVAITQAQSTFFAKALTTLTSMNVGASAVASMGGDSGTSFIILRDTCDNSMTVSGGSQITIA